MQPQKDQARNVDPSDVEINPMLKVTYHDRRTGLVAKKDPYILRVVGEGGNRTQYFERPAGSGNLFNYDGDPIGRWDASKPEGERFIAKAAHVEFVMPETDDEKLARTLATKDVRINELEAELRAIKAESAKKAAQQKVAKDPAKI